MSSPRRHHWFASFEEPFYFWLPICLLSFSYLALHLFSSELIYVCFVWVCVCVGVRLHLSQSQLKNLIECVINWNCQLKLIGWIIQVYHSCLWQDQAVKWFYYKQYGSKCNWIKALMLLKGHEKHDGIKYLFLLFLPAETNSTTLLSTYYYIKCFVLNHTVCPPRALSKEQTDRIENQYGRTDKSRTVWQSCWPYKV